MGVFVYYTIVRVRCEIHLLSLYEITLRNLKTWAPEIRFFKNTIINQCDKEIFSRCLLCDRNLCVTLFSFSFFFIILFRSNLFVFPIWKYFPIGFSLESVFFSYRVYYWNLTLTPYQMISGSLEILLSSQINSDGSSVQIVTRQPTFFTATYETSKSGKF